MILYAQICSFEWWICFGLAYLAIFWATIELDDFRLDQLHSEWVAGQCWAWNDLCVFPVFLFCYTIVSGPIKHWVTNCHLWVIFFICGFLLWNKKKQFDERKHIYINIWLYHLGCRYCRHMDYFTKCIYPVLNINWPQVHGLGLNWHEISCFQNFFKQIHQIQSKTPFTVNKKYNFNYFTTTIYIWFHWL